ncbi:MAG: hypothetical protein Ct9H300mP28_15820 [Pseudomonadota bacterium]|nr:MAG: hypothetical protein Ct9H300mP28_15820 [Pseudomonadota bacterium]
MLTEEAHHMFVGESGVGRIVQRTCELMNEYKTYDVREYGGIDLPTLQKYLNFHLVFPLIYLVRRFLPTRQHITIQVSRGD